MNCLATVHTNEETFRLARLWHQQFHRIAFVNGCFDVLHSGHLAMLTAAKRVSTRLIVAVNSDDYCRRRKGPTRPIQPAGLRAQIVRGVIDAHAVTVFDDDNPAPLLSCIQPHIYVLGSDYRGQPIPGQEHCDTMLFFDRLPNFSTTNSVANLLD